MLIVQEHEKVASLGDSARHPHRAGQQTLSSLAMEVPLQTSQQPQPRLRNRLITVRLPVTAVSRCWFVSHLAVWSHSTGDSAP